MTLPRLPNAWTPAMIADVEERHAAEKFEIGRDLVTLHVQEVSEMDRSVGVSIAEIFEVLKIEQPKWFTSRHDWPRVNDMSNGDMMLRDVFMLALHRTDFDLKLSAQLARARMTFHTPAMPEPAGFEVFEDPGLARQRMIFGFLDQLSKKAGGLVEAQILKAEEPAQLLADLADTTMGFIRASSQMTGSPGPLWLTHILDGKASPIDLGEAIADAMVCETVPDEMMSGWGELKTEGHMPYAMTAATMVIEGDIVLNKALIRAAAAQPDSAPGVGH